MVASREARTWLHQIKGQGMALGLENTARAVAEMQFSAPTYETVHVAGSNGKGTTVARLSAALSSAGIDHLAFTSPHLVRVEERVRHNGRPVDATTFDEALVQVHDMVKRTGISLTFFEATFLIFLSVAARLSVRVVLMETGLGGRLDATRAVPADVAVITSLSLEHTTVLGDTLEAIAGEKGAIARSGKPLVVQWVENPAARKRLERCAAEAGDHPLDGRLGPADLRWVKPETGANYRDQADALAALAWSHLKCAENTAYPNIPELHWPGRMQDVVSAKRSNLVFVLEGAHNPSGMRTACDELAKQHRWRRPWALLFGTSPQTDMHGMLEPLAMLCSVHTPSVVVLTEPQFGRYPGVEAGALRGDVEAFGIEVSAAIPTPSDAVEWIESNAPDCELVLCIGSLYLQGNVLQTLGADDDDALAVRAKD